MSIGKEPAPQNGQQEKLDFDQGLEKFYLDYSEEKRKELIMSIIKKRQTGEQLTEEESAFQDASKNFFNDDQPKYR